MSGDIHNQRRPLHIVALVFLAILSFDLLVRLDRLSVASNDAPTVKASGKYVTHNLSLQVPDLILTDTPTFTVTGPPPTPTFTLPSTPTPTTCPPFDWRVVNSPYAGSLNGVAVVSATDVWAVGGYNGQTLIAHWNGTAWSVVPSQNVGAGNNVLNGV